MAESDLITRTKMFTIRTFKLVDAFPKTKSADVISYQLLKSSSSVGANYRATKRAKSRADFSNKIKIVLEEADESNYWLTLIKDVELLKSSEAKIELEHLIKESDELTAIFTKSSITLSNS
jgi:four helix bundle protein